MKKLVIFLGILIVISLIAFVFNAVFLKEKSIASGVFYIKRGENVLQISANLKNQGYITNQLSFVYQTIISRNFKKLKSGKYQIKEGQKYNELINKFSLGQILPSEISIIPGKTIKDIANVLSSAYLFKRDDFLNKALYPDKNVLDKFVFLSDKPEGEGLEGYLFPDNYLVDSSGNIDDLQIQILSNFNNKLTQDLRDEIKGQNRTIFEIVTMASMLEKEVKSYKDKQIVSGILWKRADNHLPLQVDSTLLYFQTSLHPSVLEKDVDSEYNTYKYAGLPKGPICNPSLESIKAAIYSENTEYWFYLSAPSGQTIYAKTLGQHLINKAKYLSN